MLHDAWPLLANISQGAWHIIMIQLESFHNDIVSACLYASESALATKVSRRHNIPGWNDKVRVARKNAIWRHTLWKDNNYPTSGIIFDIRQKTRREYHYALRKLRNCERSLRCERMSVHALTCKSTVLERGQQNQGQFNRLLMEHRARILQMYLLINITPYIILYLIDG